MRYKTYLLFGAPGSGKGTQGKTLGSIPRFFHCPCGDVFRSIDTRTKVGQAFLEYSSKGQLVPDEVTVELWKVAIDAAVDAHKFKPDIDTLVLDGIPRNVTQAKIMEEMIDVEKVFHLSCPNRETLVRPPEEARAQRQPSGRRERTRSSNAAWPSTTRNRSRCSTIIRRNAFAVVDATQPPAKVLFDILASMNGVDGQHESATV